MKARKTKEVLASVPLKQPLVENVKPDFTQSEMPLKARPRKPLSGNLKSRDNVNSFPSREKSRLSDVDDSGMSTTFESFAEKSLHRLKKASLKDLRPEDKQRVANLIKELARVGDEKEKVVKELHGEREQYEHQLMVMVEQQEKILQEREDVQEKLFQCQKLLTEYQAQLLNKQDRLNSSIHDIKEDYPGAGRQSRSREPISRYPTNQNTDDGHLINENAGDESVSDLLLNPTETVKRPYTSMIDKEIARERSRSRGSRTSDYSRSRSASPTEGRPKFAYPQKLISTGPLHEPLASSTQKSMEIRALNYDNESVRSRTSLKTQETRSKGQQYSKSGQVRDYSPASSDSGKNRVAFNGKDEYDDDAEKHSPNLKNPAKMFSDPDYAKYYKNLSPGGRKRELLKQRQALLDEQERLRQVLEKQEVQLQTRKYEYDKRKELQQQRMEFYKEGGKFPALKLDFDNASEKGVGVEDEEKGSRKWLVGKDHASEVEMYSPRNDIEIVITKKRSILSHTGCHDDEVKVRSRVSMGASPLGTPPRNNKVTVATSPARSVDTGDSDIPRLIDVATSISYRTPLKDASNHIQGNLPLGCNRQKSSPSVQQWRETELEPTVRTPGEKTLNVIELVNSMDEELPASHYNGSYEDLENKPDRHFTPNKYITGGKGAQSSPYRQYTSPAQLRSNQPKPRTSQVQQRISQGQQRTSQGKLLSEEEESLEESKILEDIFFL
ncbi:protein hinderin-like isoform X3 [Mercenaria mercenaria]|uniref:protein hinderin-like isoform X3 n=1 Tax=Mercenaria mercenaria TaxID=6596 RepID=UPI00234E83E7|nr:protein hinderin-like isoform X3 [Mercenaria mercenaria]